MSISKFIIVTAARSGSSNLINCLKKHPNLNIFQEPFNKYYGGLDLSLFDFKIEPCQFLSDDIHNKICQVKYFDKAIEKYDGFKILDFQIRNGIEECIKNYKVVHLIRKDKMSQVVSLQVARKTNIWTGTSEFTGSIYIDPQDFIKAYIYLYKQEQINLKRYKSLIIYYEDNITDTCNKIFNYINAPSCIINNVFQKRIRKSLSEIVTNYSEILDTYEKIQIY